MSGLRFCRHCGYEIELTDMGWCHLDGYLDCPVGFGDGLRATPEVTA